MIPVEPQFHVEVDEDGAVVVAGEIDLASVDELSTQIRAALDDAGPTFVVDLAGVVFMDSSGLGLLLKIRETCTARDAVFVVRDPSAAVRRLLDITGLTHELRIT